MSNDTWHPRASGNDDAPAFVLPYATAFDPPPGEDGYFLNLGRDRGYGIFPDEMSDDRMEQWRRVILSSIRRRMEQFNAPRGTNFHQLIRLHEGLPMTEDPAEPRDPDQEDSRLIAEYEWELRQSNLAYPTDVATLLRSHIGNSQELFKSW